FRHDLLITDALRKIIMHNRGKVEIEMLHIISEIMQIKELKEYRFSIKDMLDMLKRLSIQTEASQLRKILQDNWKLEPHPPTYYTAYLFGYNDEILSSSKTARLYRITQKQVEEIMSEC
ncbi:hypothetical protein EZS27_037065, partial [termite gut metagenome]